MLSNSLSNFPGLYAMLEMPHNVVYTIRDDVLHTYPQPPSSISPTAQASHIDLKSSTDFSQNFHAQLPPLLFNQLANHILLYQTVNVNNIFII